MAESAAVNQTHFNKLAAEYDARFEKTVAVLEQKVKDDLDFIGVKPGARLLDYACGTGLLSRAMSGRVSQCVGIDVSENMVEAYNAKCKTEGISPETRIAHVGNLLLPSDPSPAALSGPEFFNFDVAGVGAGFHHFEDCSLAAKQLAERLKPGGVLFILDFLPNEILHGGSHGVHHTGFSEDQMRKLYEGAGVGGGFTFKDIGEVVFHNMSKDGKEMRKHVFFARGTKL